MFNVTARQDLNNVGGTIAAASALSASPGRDLNVITTTSSGASQIGLNSFSRTGLERIAGLYVGNPGGTLLASAGRDVNLVAGILQSQGSVGIDFGSQSGISVNASANKSQGNADWQEINPSIGPK